MTSSEYSADVAQINYSIFLLPLFSVEFLMNISNILIYKIIYIYILCIHLYSQHQYILHITLKIYFNERHVHAYVLFSDSWQSTEKSYKTLNISICIWLVPTNSNKLCGKQIHTTGQDFKIQSGVSTVAEELPQKTIFYWHRLSRVEQRTCDAVMENVSSPGSVRRPVMDETCGVDGARGQSKALIYPLNILRKLHRHSEPTTKIIQIFRIIFLYSDK